MLSEQEKNEMLADGLNSQRCEEFRSALKNKVRQYCDLDGYIAFLMDLQMIKPFEHKAHVTITSKNIL